jgi:pSer/pThr/pTyr-binding forkhead associated (FHA) protein
MSGSMDRTMVAPASGNATMQMPSTLMGNDPMRTQIGGTITCPICKSTTPLMDNYCGDCGFLLSSTPAETIETPVEEAPVAELVDVVDGRRYRLRAGVNTLGRMGTDVLSADGTVSRNHATLTVQGDRVIIEDLGSSNGTKVGDRRIGPNQPTEATHGTPLRFGNWRLMLELASGMGTGSADKTVVVSEPDRTLVTAPPEAAPAPPADPETAASSEMLTGPAPALIARLTCLSGPAGTIDVPEGVITIGRKPGNTIVIAQDSYVSSRHAEIFSDLTGTYLTDLGSTNGTVVNGQKMIPNERHLLLDGDEIQLGQSKFRFALLIPEEKTSDDEISGSEA